MKLRDMAEPVARDSYSTVSQSLTTMDGLSLAKLWLRDCEITHQSCSSSIASNNSFLPTRLVDLRDEEPRLRLFPIAEPSIKYATLSHCWGTTKRTVLTQSALPQFLNRIPPEAISKTFQDAMLVAKYLGFEYIWIDSLCIIQDSYEDWKREAALMRDVYGESGITIAASGATDGTVGCFFGRDSIWRCQIRIKLTAHPLYIICVPKWLNVRLLDGMPLMSRGWCVVEKWRRKERRES